MRLLAIMTVLVSVELVLVLFFIVDLLAGRGNNILLGTILGIEFLMLAVVIILYMLAFVPPREVVEDRDEGLLW
jgi:cadmium resistance protein CadD (predicted permease)